MKKRARNFFLARVGFESVTSFLQTPEVTDLSPILAKKFIVLFQM